MASQPAQDIVAAEDAPGLAGQHQQQFIFGAGQRHFLVVTQHTAPDRIDHQPLETQHRNILRLRATGVCAAP